LAACYLGDMTSLICKWGQSKNTVVLRGADEV
jgi:hypothetical protein